MGETKVLAICRMGRYQLYYFPVRGRAQAIRYFFKDNGIEYEEINMVVNWMEDFKPKMIFGQGPMLKDGDFEVAQANTILRYLGRNHGMYPVDNKEAAKVDMIMDFTHELRELYIRMVYENFEKGKDDFVKNAKVKLQYLEKLFKIWGNEYILPKITCADYVLFDMLDWFVILTPTGLDELQLVKDYYNRIASRPDLKKYRDTDEVKNMMVNGSGNQ